MEMFEQGEFTVVITKAEVDESGDDYQDDSLLHFTAYRQFTVMFDSRGRTPIYLKPGHTSWSVGMVNSYKIPEAEQTENLEEAAPAFSGTINNWGQCELTFLEPLYLDRPDDAAFTLGEIAKIIRQVHDWAEQYLPQFSPHELPAPEPEDDEDEDLL